MLSSVLRSERAAVINIQIMRAFVRIRQIVQQSREIQAALQKMEKRLDGHDNQIRVAFNALKGLMGQPLTVKVLPEPPEYTPPGQRPYAKDGRKRMGFGPKGEGRMADRVSAKSRKVTISAERKIL